MGESGKRVAVVTGAGSGIGRATAIALAKEGYRLVLAGRGGRALVETAKVCHPNVGISCEAVDVGIAADCARLVAATVEHFGRLDVLVNNAGVAPALPIDRHTPELIDEVFRVNALGPAWLIASAWPVMVRQKSGCIVNVSSMATKDPFEGLFGYASAKAAVNLMAQSCAKEGAAHGIRAFAVAPGAVETQMLRKIVPESMLPRDQTLSPEDVARVIVDCIAGRRDEQNGQTIYMSKSAE